MLFDVTNIRVTRTGSLVHSFGSMYLSLRFNDFALHFQSAKENEAIMKALDKNWDFINEQIDKTFSGIKTESKRIK